MMGQPAGRPAAAIFSKNWPAGWLAHHVVGCPIHFGCICLFFYMLLDVFSLWLDVSPLLLGVLLKMQILQGKPASNLFVGAVMSTQGL